MSKLIIVRHGQTNWDKENRIQGALDIPLNSEGKNEAQKVAEELSSSKINVVFSSPAACSLSTANEIALHHNIKVRKTPEFNELDQGIWQGLLIKDVKKRYKKHYNSWKSSPAIIRPPRGECAREAYDRAISMMHKIVDKHKDESICVVSHDIILSLIKCYHGNIALEKMWRFMSNRIWWEELDF
ncbi:MAG: histidine phosphatase family protein [Candidatus Omnitrophica bacterium]|nr:histidine phosphatase family protein [Candidatus Omnitrophota bacterium]